ncbi:amidohydrolase family protein [Povalibacter sp.]|uniref:amidohydrolase family protein n=1 Tax=Povalibacter sp. TaxID=1962978 RepID=UPI002F3E5017
MAPTKKTPIDPLSGPRYVLDGRIVTMNGASKVIARGRVYVADGVIRAVRDAAAAAPADFQDAPVIATAGTIFPGLIELHNHLSYNALQLWQVPRIFAHRGQWSGHPDKRRLISQPMSVLASIGGTIEALVRYVESKCLVAGVTTSQGLTLVADAGIQHSYRGIVRNVENTDDPALPEALTRIADVENAAAFAKRLKSAGNASLLLHLSEGIGDIARQHFLRLKLQGNSWAITPALIGIHAAGLLPQDLAVMAENGGSIVWSPLSNLLLYGGTADVKSTKAAGVAIALGSDWSPSGSKNLLSELKVARAFSDRAGGIFSSRDLVAMTTINPARMLKWDTVLGSIEPDKRADFVIIKGRTGDPYEKLLKALEDDIQLVVINGIPRFGTAPLMDKATTALFAAPRPILESRKVGGKAMKFNFVQETADPIVAAVPLAVAEQRLQDGLRNLPDLASGLAVPMLAASLLGVTGAVAASTPVRRWTLELENEPPAQALPGNETLRPLAPAQIEPESSAFGGDALAFNAAAAANLVSMELDALTVIDDSDYFDRIASQINLPVGFAAAVARLHGAPAPAAPDARSIHLPPVADSPAQVEAALPRSLTELRSLRDTLSREERIQLVRQLRLVLEEIYVHLPLKRAAHAIDPLQGLRLLQYSLEEATVGGGNESLDGIAFHERVMTVFTQLRDLHTVYLLPAPYNDLMAFLPFLLERCYKTGNHKDDLEPRPMYLVTKVATSLQHPTFKAGVEVLYWNGMPIVNAIDQNAQRQGGSNPAARFARGLAGMTVRPLGSVLPPQEEWVLMTYRSLDGRILEIRLPWQIRSSTGSVNFEVPPLSARSVQAASGRDASRRQPRRSSRMATLGSLAAFGFDVQMEAVNSARRDLYARAAAKRRRGARPIAVGEDLPTRFPSALRARIVATPRGKFGHLRIFTFSVSDADRFVDEVVRLLGLLPAKGLILDVRGNGGGLIWASEQLLQLFTNRTIEPERAQFLSSPRTLDLARRHAGAPLDLQPWIDSIARSTVTGAVYSEGFPITPAAKANALGRRYKGPVVLITDALAYSATDIFAAGFRDHAIGPILGVDDNTGAGGANVWSYALLQDLFADKEPSLAALPGGCDVRVAIRRTLRVGASAGMPLEDLGVVPDARHYLTRRDVLGSNEDLMAHAAGLLARRTA